MLRPKSYDEWTKSAARMVAAALQPQRTPPDLWDRIGFRPQPGPQTDFLSSEADITIYGGAAGGGKTFGEILDPLQWMHVPGFGAVIFRRMTTQVRAEGGLWDESEKVYPALDATPRQDRLEWRFPNGNSITFAHMEYEQNRFDWQGAQICHIAFDELTHFTKKQFFYLLSRNRSTCGVKPRIRATCNPDADSWVAEFIAWWIDEESGYPDPERAGCMRWFVQYEGSLEWSDSREELIERFPEMMPTSVVFIPANLDDNPALTSRDPGYRGKLMALDMVERERLEKGNWKIRPVAGNFFRREWFEIVDEAPPCEIAVRFWDFAGSKKTKENRPDWTVGLLYGWSGPLFYVLDVVRFQESPGTAMDIFKSTANLDGYLAPIIIEQEPGSASLYHIANCVDALPGHIVIGQPSSGDKRLRAKPASAAAEHGRIKLVRGDWNRAFLAELEYFPDGSHDDQVDGLSGAHKAIADVIKALGMPDHQLATLSVERVDISPI